MDKRAGVKEKQLGQMNHPVQSDLTAKDSRGSPWPWAVLALVVCLVAINSQSLWIDEAFTAAKAAQTTLPGWWQAMTEGKGSDLQMPFYMIYIWAFANIFGHSEWMLRAANIPWFILGIAAFIPAIPRNYRLPLGLVALLSPFAWYYLNEARPYAMQLGSSLVVLAAFFQLRETAPESRLERTWVIASWLGIIVLCGSSLLGVIWAGAFLLCAPIIFTRARLRQLARAHWFASLLSAAILALLAMYFVWTLKIGARASAAGTTDLRNAPFIAYELLGFTGLGPGRLDIRGGGFSAFKPYAVPLLCYAAVTGVLILLAARNLYRSSFRKTVVGLAFVLFAASVLLLIAGFVLRFRVLGRHFTPLLPAVWISLACGIAAGRSAARWLPKFFAGCFFILSLASCLSLRFASRHEKDDYRDAAQTAITALNQGKTVWWSAADDGAAYYHLPLASAAGETGRALLVLNPTPQALSTLPAPDMVVTSKPDLYDNQQALEKYVRNNPFAKIAAFPAFNVWQRQSIAHRP